MHAFVFPGDGVITFNNIFVIGNCVRGGHQKIFEFIMWYAPGPQWNGDQNYKKIKKIKGI